MNFVDAKLPMFLKITPQLIIDGQQLKTVTLLIAAFNKVLGDEEPVDGFSARKLRNYYLLTTEESGERHYKLLLSQTYNKALLQSLVKATNWKMWHLMLELRKYQLS